MQLAEKLDWKGLILLLTNKLMKFLLVEFNVHNNKS
jgi:hypothetical protein